MQKQRDNDVIKNFDGDFLLPESSERSTLSNNSTDERKRAPARFISRANNALIAAPINISISMRGNQSEKSISRCRSDNSAATPRARTFPNRGNVNRETRRAEKRS
jgi:hypothetical protein